MRHGGRDAVERVVVPRALLPPQPLRPLPVARFGLRTSGDPSHRRDHLRRPQPDRRLAREHHGVGAVEHRVGDVADLGAGGRRRLDHRLEHLRGRDHRQADLHAMAHDPLLEVRHVLQRAVDPEVAAGDHQRVRCLGDRRQLGERGAGLDLGDDAGALPDDFAQLVDVVGPADERQRDVVDARRGDGLGEHEILSRRRPHLQPLARQVDAWPTLCPAAALDFGLELGRRRGDDPHRDGAVAEHDPIAEIDVLQQRVVPDADPLRVARSVARHQGDDGSLVPARRHLPGTGRRGSSALAGPPAVRRDDPSRRRPRAPSPLAAGAPRWRRG